jgi:hypothetical protein
VRSDAGVTELAPFAAPADGAQLPCGDDVVGDLRRRGARVGRGRTRLGAPAPRSRRYTVVHSEERAWGCHYYEADWPAIASAAVAIFEESIDPLDDDAIFARNEAVGEQSLDGLAQLVAMAVVVSRAAARLPQA